MGERNPEANQLEVIRRACKSSQTGGGSNKRLTAMRNRAAAKVEALKAMGYVTLGYDFPYRERYL
jgi:hypothetical protein